MASRRPRLTTEREDIILEPWGAHHKDGLIAAADDEQIARYMTNQFPYPYTDQDADEWLAICAAQDPPLSFATLVEGVVAGGLGRRPGMMCGRGRPRSDGGYPRARAGEAGLGFGFGRQPSHLASGR